MHFFFQSDRKGWDNEERIYFFFFLASGVFQRFSARVKKGLKRLLMEIYGFQLKSAQAPK